MASPSGTYIDAAREIFQAKIIPELQQETSFTMGLIKMEKGMGLKTHITKKGKSTGYEKTQRYQKKLPQDAVFEDRTLTYRIHAADELMDEVDLRNMIDYGVMDVTMSLAAEIGRKIDSHFVEVLGGSQAVINNGSASTTSVGATVAVDSHAFSGTSASNDICLTTSKLKEAIKEIGSAHGNVTGKQLYVLGNINQFMKLSIADEVVSSDYRGTKPLDIAGLFPGLDGYLGLRFIQYEDIPVDSNSDEVVYVFSEDAMVGQVRKPLTVTVDPQTDTVENPNMVSAVVDLGFARKHDELVVEIKCDPTTVVPA